MPSSHQQQSLRRKLVYFALVVGLLTLSWVYRALVVEARADQLELREQNVGEVELTGAAVRLLLTGSRGLVITSLWMAADDKQRRNEWNKLDLLVQSLTRLQPHSSSAWTYHGWNLAFNVSTQLEEGRDQYFYIARGIQLLEEGSRRLRNNPDLRLMIGDFYQFKLGQGDDSRLLQTLFQLSCLDPRERDPQRLVWTPAERAADPAAFARFCREQPQMRTPDGEWVHPGRFEEFCRAHPQLARRLRERRIKIDDGRRVYHDVRPRSPGEVVAFLARNQKIPSRYEVVDGRLAPAREPFPVLPPRFDRDEYSEESRLDDGFDPYLAARAWYIYAQVPVPPADGVPGPRVPAFDPRRYRLPQRPALIMFRAKPAQAQTFAAQRLQREGWFDAEGWAVDEGREGRNQWFPGRRVVVGAGRDHAAEAWQRADAMWRRYGEQTGLRDLEPKERQRLTRLAEHYRSAFGVVADQLGPELRPEQRGGNMGEAFDAHRFLYWYDYWRDPDRTNYPHFAHQARAEMTAGARAARKLFARAEQLRQRDEPPALVLDAYERGFAHWGPLLQQHRDFRRSEIVQEETCELQLRYLELLQQARGGDLKRLLLVQDYLTHLGRPAPIAVWLPPVHLLPIRRLPAPVVAGLDRFSDEQGKPLLDAEIMKRVRGEKGAGE